jgi:hypothetical protein
MPRRLVNLLVKVVDLVDEPANQDPFLVIKSKEESARVEGAVWTTAEVNDFPDANFLLVDDGGSKDGEGKTTPRSLRHLPYRDKSGKVDLAHLRNALARIPQMKTDEATKKRLTEHAHQILSQEGGGGSKETKAMDNKSTQGGAQTSVAKAKNEKMEKAMATAESILSADQALAKALSAQMESVIQSVVVSKTMTPEKLDEACKAAGELVDEAMKEPDEEMRKSALAKAKDLIERFHKSTTMMQPGPQVPSPTGAGGEAWNGSNKPEGNLKPQFTAKATGFTAGMGSTPAEKNPEIQTGAGGTPPAGSPPGPEPVKVTSFPGGGDITNAVRKAAEDLTKAMGEFAKSFGEKPVAPLEKKEDAACPAVPPVPLEKKEDAAPVVPVAPLEKKEDARGTVGPQASGEGPVDEITKALRDVTARVDMLVKGNVGSGSKGVGDGGTDGDAAGKIEKSKSFWSFL